MKSEKFWSWYDSHVVPRINGKRFGNDIDRSITFRKMLEHLEGIDKPVIVETGCVEDETDEKWAGNGNSTIIFDKYASLNGGTVYSVDIIPELVAGARKLVSKRTKVTCSDSVKFLSKLKVSPDLLYLDASHHYWHHQVPSQVHHYNELMAVMPMLKPTTLVVVDDSPAMIDEQVRYRVEGKGGLVGAYASEVGVDLVFTQYQTGWMGFPGRADNTKPSIDSLIAKARQHLEDGKWLQAYDLYRAILIRTPPPWGYKDRVIQGEACAFFARLAVQYDRLGAAMDWYGRALIADPLGTDYRIELVNKVLRPLRVLHGGREQAVMATRVAPEDPSTWRALGLMESELGNLKKGVAAHGKQVEVSGRSTVALLDKAATLIDIEEYDQAELLCDEALNRKETIMLVADAKHCKAMICARRAQHEEAIELYKQALDEGPSDPSQCHFHLSLSLHSIGRYKEGWEHHSKRAKNRTNQALWVPMRRFVRPLFKDQPPPATIHVHSESGAGDNFALWRFMPLLAKQGYTVRFEASDDLFRLAKDSLTGIDVVKQALDWPGSLGVKDFDYHVPVGELPHVFGIEVDTVPWFGPYIKADQELSKKYRDVPKIGIAWSSGILTNGPAWLKRYGELKSLSFEQIRPIIHALPMLSFVSLQVGAQRDENDEIADVLPAEPNWTDTAALIDNLDLVITPDTGLAHLAGAMGKPTWLMMHRHNQGWHFMAERPGAPWNERSPWYPSVRIFRQKTNAWEPVVMNIAAAVQAGLEATEAA